MSRYIDIHIIQSVPYANLNRDDTGSPKSASYGGVDRIRVSSQAWKRPMRSYLEDRLSGQADYDAAARTINYVEILTDILTEHGMSKEDATHAGKVVFKNPKKGFPKDKPSDDLDDAGETGDDPTGEKKRVLLFLTQSQYDDLARYVLDNQADISKAVTDTKDSPNFTAHRKALGDIIAEPRGLIRLFGRMLAHLPVANTDSAVQVAHALTVHAQIAEPDYLTAVEDHPLENRTGAAHLLSADFASGTFYRYANINLDTLTHNGVTPQGARVLAAESVRAFVLSMPTGKASATAPRTRPAFVAVEAREAPENLVNAFERPVRANGQGFVVNAIQALTEHAQRTRAAFGEQPSFSAHVTTTPAAIDTSVFGEATTFDELLTDLLASI
jgi:CRISPR system Cascade subunit CasC